MSILSPNPAERTAELERVIRKWSAITGVSLTKVGEHIGLEQKEFDRRLRGERAMRASDLFAIAQVLGPGFLDDLLAPLGMRTVQSDVTTATTRDVFAAQLEAQRETSELQTVTAAAAADGKITPSERARIETEAQEAKRAIDVVVATAKAAEIGRA
jgi:hypothetical protein